MRWSWRQAPRCVRRWPAARHPLVLSNLAARWGAGRSFACMARFRRLARDYGRLPTTLAGLHFIAFACPMLARATLHFQIC
jgi:hypothetical protein